MEECQQPEKDTKCDEMMIKHTVYCTHYYYNHHQKPMQQHNLSQLGNCLYKNKSNIHLYTQSDIILSAVHRTTNRCMLAVCRHKIFKSYLCRQNQNQNHNRFIRSYYRPRRPLLRPIWSLSQRPTKRQTEWTAGGSGTVALASINAFLVFICMFFL